MRGSIINPEAPDSALQYEHSLYENMRARFGEDDEKRPQKWGDSVALQNNPAVPQATIQAEQVFVDVGPFPVPRPIYLDTDVFPRLQAGGAFITNRPCYAYRLIIGIGHGAVIEETFNLPATVFGTSLQVYARRLQHNSPDPAGGFRKQIWATTLGESPSSPTVVAYETFSLGIGTALADMNPPWWTTHMMTQGQGGENSQTLSVTFQAPPQNGGGNGNMRICYTAGASGAAGTAPVPVPVPRNMSSYAFRREVTTALQNYTVWYCR